MNRNYKGIHTGIRVAAIIVFIAGFLVSPAVAQVYHMYPGAPAVEKDAPALGVTVAFGDHLFRTLGYGRFNINPVSDIGVEIVADNGNDVWRSGAGADFKYNIVPKESTLPFDLAVNGGLGFITGHDVTNVDIPLGGLVSRPLELSNGGVLVPYGGVYILISHLSWSTALGDESDWETDVELRGGAGYQITKTSLAYANLQFGAGTRFYIGIRFIL
jgi:hypothetical protein